MKLLIVTQKVNKNDSVLGFFHGWLSEFAKHCEQVTVIALSVGEYDLPKNVKVLSLGKEGGTSRLKYIFRFYKYIWSERKNYDAVFVHMNPEYVVLGGALWRLLGKKIGFWYNHKVGTLKTRIAIFLAHRIFCTSPYAFTARSKKIKLMPAGIDMNTFTTNVETTREKDSILYLGRIAPVKNLHQLVNAVMKLHTTWSDIRLDIVGSALPKDEHYKEAIIESAQELVASDKIRFLGSISNRETPSVYNAHELFVNLTDSGSFDKAILEAMACGSLVLVSNKSFIGVISEDFIFIEGDVDDLVKKITYVLSLSQEEKNRVREELRMFVAEKHSLEMLASELMASLGA